MPQTTNENFSFPFIAADPSKFSFHQLGWKDPVEKCKCYSLCEDIQDLGYGEGPPKLSICRQCYFTKKWN